MGKIASLTPLGERRKAFRLPVAVLAVADGRRRDHFCSHGRGHRWHHLPGADRPFRPGHDSGTASDAYTAGRTDSSSTSPRRRGRRRVRWSRVCHAALRSRRPVNGQARPGDRRTAASASR
ncbi:DUF5958 family protein [Streptomyces sp. NPDC088766]|uniref:DUF5958 family protein n=1 Tax=Streptomyces sp. NPDC088766 TaxID=3365893 RepID=UPI003821C244